MSSRKYFVVFLLGVFFCFAADTSIVDLSSSFNIDDGVGTTSLAICYAVSIVAALPTPAVGHKVGCKRLLMIGEVGYLMYILGNLYSGFATLVPAGFFLGIGEAWVWTALPIITTYFAKQQQSEKESFERHLRRFTGYYLAVIELSTFAGSALSFTVLHIDRSLSNHPTTNITSKPRDLTVCGANDCQIPNITRANEEQYHPVYPTTKYLFIAIISGMSVVAIVLFYFYIPDEIAWDLEEGDSTDDETKTQLNSFESEKSTSDEVLKHRRDSPVVANGNLLVASTLIEKQEIECDVKISETQTSICSLLVQSVIDSYKLSVSGKHLLIVLLPIYNGTSNGLLFGELTRAFASCILGVDHVGICMMVYAVTTCIACVACGKFSARYGRNIPFLLATAVDVASYVFCLNWNITTDNTWLVYVLFSMFGVSLAIWNTLIIALYGEYFGDDHKLAYNLWNIVCSIGLMWQFAVSTYFCVYVKIYIQLGLLGGAMITYFISQVMYYPEQCRLIQIEKKNDKTVTDC